MALLCAKSYYLDINNSFTQVIIQGVFMKIYIGNLNHETAEPQIRESFEKYGEVTSLNLVMDKQSGKSKGFAFVEMSSQEHGEKAIAGLNGEDLGGNILKVNQAKEQK